jgi:uncharacterized membrane protein
LFFHYHLIVFTFPLICWGFYFLFESKNEIIGIVLLLIACLGKEDVGLTIGFIFFYKFFQKKELRFLVLGIFCILFSLVAVKYLIPFFRGVSQDSIGKYIYLGENISEIIKNISTNPKFFHQAFLTR